jgi:uncharacterized protein YoxC
MWHLLLSTILLISSNAFFIGKNDGRVNAKLEIIDLTEQRVTNLEKQVATKSTSNQKDIEHFNEFKEDIKQEVKEIKIEMKEGFNEINKSIKDLSAEIKASTPLIGSVELLK